MGIAVVSRHQYSNHQNSSFWPPFWLLPQLKLTPKFSTILTAITHLGTLDTLGTPTKLPLLFTPNPRSKSKRSSPSNTRSNNLLLTPTLLFKLPPPNKLHLNKCSPHCTRDFTRL